MRRSLSILTQLLVVLTVAGDYLYKQTANFGPYSEGLTCNSSNSFIEPILQALSDDRPVNAINTLAVGCYCPWASDAP